VPSGNPRLCGDLALPLPTGYEEIIQKEKTNEGCYKAPHGFSFHSFTSGDFDLTAGL